MNEDKENVLVQGEGLKKFSHLIGSFLSMKKWHKINTCISIKKDG